MPLGDDQKAMLRLLAREQSYEDIAALMGLSVEEVAARAESAVAELEAEGIPAPALPRAPTGESASAAEPSKPKPVPATPPAKAERPQPTPAAKPDPKPAAPATPASRPTPPSSAQPQQPRSNRDLLTIGGAVVAGLVIVVLVVLLLSGGDDGGDGTTAASGDGSNLPAGLNSKEPTTAKLTAADGSDASGEATFGRVQQSLGLEVKAEGLAPAPRGSIYMVWLADTPQKMLPLTAVAANKAGRINASYEVPTEAVVYLASGEFDEMVITRSRNRDLQKSLVDANREKDFPEYTGVRVLEGTVEGPIIGAAKRLEEAEADGE